ncbi:MAG: ABC transporter permease DevC [Planctomycetales bacterium]|nr:ABC transporter permease DevC [Planctomycetales bacterium]
MRTPLAWLNLIHNKTRTALAAAGVAFAVVLIFMQLGFLGSAERSATLFYDALDFDLLVRSRHYLHLIASRTFPRDRLDQAESLPGVERASPVYLVSDFWRNPHDGSKRAMLIVGLNPNDPVFRREDIQRKLALLTVPEFVLIDDKSRREFGPQDRRRFGKADIGDESELSRQRVRIVECFSLGTGFVADGAVVACVRGFQRFRPRQAPGQVSLGLVKLLPGADAEAAAAALNNALPEDVEVLTRADVLDREVHHWVQNTSIGLIFQLGVVVALVVGTAIVYQVLSSDVANHLPEYATLKAIGYGGGYLAGVVLQQAAMLAVLGFLPGLAISAVLYWLTRAMARVPIEMTVGRVFFVFGLSVLMCTISGLGALRKVRSADPADLF